LPDGCGKYTACVARMSIEQKDWMGFFNTLVISPP